MDFVGRNAMSAILCLFDCRFQITDVGGHIAFTGRANPWTMPKAPIPFCSLNFCILPEHYAFFCLQEFPHFSNDRFCFNSFLGFTSGRALFPELIEVSCKHDGHFSCTPTFGEICFVLLSVKHFTHF